MVSLVVVTLSSWAANGLNNSKNFKNAARELYAGQGAVQIAMRAARYTPPSALPGICPGTPVPIPIDALNVQVWCSTVNKGGLRDTTLTACLTASNLTGLCTVGSLTVPTLLVAEVYYLDANYYNPVNPNCSSTNQSSCGVSMTVYRWESRTS